MPTANLNRIQDLAKSAGVGANPSIAALTVDINKSLLTSGAMSSIGTLDSVNRWKSSPAMAGHLWTKPTSALRRGRSVAPAPAVPYGESTVDDVAEAAWTFAERVGQWGQSLPDPRTRSLILHLGGALISLAATAVTAHEGGGGSTVIAAAWMVLSVAMWINSLIDKIQD
jgi:hypothetical protein